MALTPENKSRIETLISSKNVFLFMKGSKSFPQCGFSATVIQILDGMGVEYATFNVLSDPEIRDGIKEYANWPTIPQLYVGGEFLGGCDIVKEMARSGELQGKLGVAAPAAAAQAAPANVKPPRIHVTQAAARVLEGAVQENREPVHLRVSQRFDHDLALGPKEPGEILAETDAPNVEIYVDAASAPRANGMTIDYLEEASGAGFKLTNPNAPPAVKKMSVRDLKKLIEGGEHVALFDVRTEGERQTARIEAARMWDDAARDDVRKLPKDALIAFHCHHGGRSRKAAETLVAEGYTNVHNVEGGIDAWSLEIDSSVPRY